MLGQLIGAGIGFAGSLIGGYKAAKAARNAGNLVATSYEDEARQAEAMEGRVNPYLADAYAQGQRKIEDTAGAGADLIEARGREANTMLDPYTGLGSRAAMSLSEFTDPQKKFSAADLEFDPGYQFRLAEGQKALEKSAAARGGAMGGGTMRALTRYAQGAASQEYAAAFDRFRQTQQDRFSNLSTLANLGYGASSQAGANLINTGTNAAGMRTRAGELSGQLGIQGTTAQTNNTMRFQEEARQDRLLADQARASGMVGNANAWSQAISGAGNAIGGGLSLWDMSRSMKSPNPIRPMWGFGGGGGGYGYGGYTPYGYDPRGVSA